MLCQHAAALGVGLHELNRPHTGAVKPEAKPPDPAKKVQYAQHGASGASWIWTISILCVRTRQHVCAQVLTLLCVCAIGKGMNMPRINKPVNTTLPPDLLADLDAWIAQQPVPPSRSAVIVASLREFLSRHGAMKETKSDATGES